MTKKMKTMARREPWREKAKNLFLAAVYCSAALLAFNGLGTALNSLVLGRVF